MAQQSSPLLSVQVVQHLVTAFYLEVVMLTCQFWQTCTIWTFNFDTVYVRDVIVDSAQGRRGRGLPHDLIVPKPTDSVSEVRIMKFGGCYE